YQWVRRSGNKNAMGHETTRAQNTAGPTIIMTPAPIKIAVRLSSDALAGIVLCPFFWLTIGTVHAPASSDPDDVGISTVRASGVSVRFQTRVPAMCFTRSAGADRLPIWPVFRAHVAGNPP